MKPFSYMNKNVNKLNILRVKRALKIKQKAFFIIFKELLLEQIKSTFLESEGLILTYLK